MLKAVVTGANGFIGQAVVNELIGNGVEVAAVVRSENNFFLENDFVKTIFLDVNEIEKLKQRIKECDIFYHLAWDGTSGKDRQDISIQLKNIENTIKCIEVAADMGCEKFIGAGSLMEHEVMLTYKKGIIPKADHIYSSAKLMAKLAGTIKAKEIGITPVWAMITNVYGPGESSPRFLNQTLRKIIAGEPLMFSSGTQNYDFLYITDAAKGFYLLGEKGVAGEYTLGSGNAKPLKEYISIIQKTLASDRKFIYGKDQEGNAGLPIFAYDIEKLKGLEFSPEISFEIGIRKTYDRLVEEQERKGNEKL